QSQMTEGFSLVRYIDKVEHVDTIPPSGRVVRTVGLLIESAGPRASLGEVCEIVGGSGDAPLPVQVVGFREGIVLSVPLGAPAGVRPGARGGARAGAGVGGGGAGALGRGRDGAGRA